MAADDAPSTTRLLLWCGAVAGPLFIAMFLLEGATAAHYNPLRHPVSSLALAPAGWLQVANFLIAGTLYLAFAAGLWRTRRTAVGTRVGVILIAAAGVGLLGSGLFITDPVSGYPPGTPDAPGDYTTTGALHDLCAIPIFLGIPAAQIAFGSMFVRRRNYGWALYSIGSAVAMLVALVSTNMAFNQVAALVHVGGLLQRITISIGFAWLTALASRTLAAIPTD
jgi:hypothetical membrane protein